MDTDATASSGAEPAAILRQTDSYVITMANQKGGQGKSMMALGFAAHVAHSHGRALLVDVDPQATSYDFSAVMEDPGYDFIHELDPRQLAKTRQLRRFDSIIVDTPGSLGALLTSQGSDEGDQTGAVLAATLRESTFVLIPYNHKPEAVLPTLRTAEAVRESGVPFAVVVTMADTTRGAKWTEEWIAEAQELLASKGVPFFRTAIREYRAWPNSLRERVPITRYNERYAPRIREDISRLWTEMQLELGRHPQRAGVL